MQRIEFANFTTILMQSETPKLMESDMDYT